MPCISSKVVPFLWQRPDQREITLCFCKSKNIKPLAQKIQAIFFSISIRKNEAYFLQFCILWLIGLLTKVSNFGWIIYKVLPAVSSWHLVHHPGAFPRLQTCLPHLPLTRLYLSFALLSTQIKPCSASQRASIMNDKGIRIPGYVPGCIKGQWRYILKRKFLNKIFVDALASLSDRAAVDTSSFLSLLLSQNM